eukprot:3849319-Prymnesium_polylepis.1
MQRFPEVASVALAPVRAGMLTSELVVTVKSAFGLRLRAHGRTNLPYVHFDFFDFGEQETHAREGRNPVYDQAFRFPVDLDGSFTEVLKQGTLRFAVFDEHEEDSEAALGLCGLPLAELLQATSFERELQLKDVGGEAAGSLVVALELR